MQMSDLKRAALILRPGNLESVLAEAQSNGNTTMAGLLSGAKQSRNRLYIGFALATIGGVGLLFSERPYSSTAAFSFGTALTILAAKNLITRMNMLSLLVNTA